MPPPPTVWVYINIEEGYFKWKGRCREVRESICTSVDEVVNITSILYDETQHLLTNLVLEAESHKVKTIIQES